MLQVSQLHGFNGRPRTPVTVTYLTSALDNVDKTSSFTFSSQSFGTAASDRIIAVFISNEGPTNASISGVTIGGVAATRANSADGGWDGFSASLWSCIWYAQVPTGTSGNVVVSWGGGATRRGMQVALWAIYNANPTPYAHNINPNNGTQTGRTTTLDIPAGGACITGYSVSATGGPPTLASGATSRGGESNIGTDDSSARWGDTTSETLDTGHVITYSHGSVTALVVPCSVSWAPASG